jgi:vacuolar-type H+-ATPase subunit E/Vma4
MNEKNDYTHDVIRNVEDEASEVIDEIIEEAQNEAFDIVVDTIEEAEKENEEEVAEETSQIEEKVTQEVEDLHEETPIPAKAKKNEKAHRLVEKAKKIVQEANDQAQECRLLLESDLKEYNDAKEQLKTGGLDECISLVEKLGYHSNDEHQEENVVVFEAKEKVKPIVLKDISSGKFTGLLFSLFGGAATAIGLVYLATEKLDMTLNVTRVPSEDIVQSLLAWFSTIIGIHENVNIGAAVFGTSVFLVMILIYWLRVSLRANRNLHFAAKQFVEAQLYTEQKANCKEEMDKVDAHIKDTIETLKTYEIVLNEQRGKLRRILHIEGMKDKSTDYHDKSYLEIRDTKELIHTIKDFINTPMSQEGKLSSKSILLLQNTKDQINKILKRFY